MFLVVILKFQVVEFDVPYVGYIATWLLIITLSTAISGYLIRIPLGIEPDDSEQVNHLQKLLEKTRDTIVLLKNAKSGTSDEDADAT